MTDAVETVRPLELLHRTAGLIGATVCLTATADRFQRHGDGHERLKPFTNAKGSQLSKLLVVRAAIRPGSARWDCLARGYVLAYAEIADPVRLDDVASVLVEELQERIAEAERRNTA